MKIILLLIALIPSVLYSQNASDSLTYELSKLTGDSALAGFAVAIVNQDGIYYANGFGFSDRENQIPYTTTTVQPIASISKTLIGISLMKACELGLLNLNDNINKYLPFEIVNPRFPDSVITIKHLANHTSGLRDTKHYEKSYIFATPIPKLQKNFPFGLTRLAVKKIVNGYNRNEEMPLEEFIRNFYIRKGKWYRRKNFGKEPPEREYAYCNNGAAIASMVIEKASGKKYTDFVKTYILSPLGMEKSGWDLSDYDSTRKSKLYPFFMEIPEYKLITLADGGFITNVTDFSKYLSAVARGYNGEDNIISSESYSKMLREDISFGQGVFWNVKELDDENYIGHTGGDPGIQTIAIFDKRTNIGYICFTNTNTPTGDELEKALELMLKYSGEYIQDRGIGID